ncbi:MAG: LPS biosynthesis protein WbpP [Armatimonadota bacterium]
MAHTERTFLVTGGAGFIGSHLVQFLLQHGRVRVLDNLTSGRIENLQQVLGQIEFIKGSVTDPALVAEAVAGCQVVFHLAAQVSVPYSLEVPNETFEVNLLGTQYVLESARQAGVERVVFASSAAVYGDAPRLPKRETMCPKPISPYAWTKWYGELLCQDYYRVYSLPTVCLRFFNVYGPRQNPHSPYAAVVPRWMECALSGRQPLLFGDGKQVRDFIYIDDLVQGLWLGATHLDAPGEVYNLASGQPATLWELLRAIEAVCGRSLEPQLMPPRAGDIRRSYADIHKIQSRLGFQPQVSLREGIRRTMEAYRTEEVAFVT